MLQSTQQTRKGNVNIITFHIKSIKSIIHFQKSLRDKKRREREKNEERERERGSQKQEFIYHIQKRKTFTCFAASSLISSISTQRIVVCGNKIVASWSVIIPNPPQPTITKYFGCTLICEWRQQSEKMWDYEKNMRMTCEEEWSVGLKEWYVCAAFTAAIDVTPEPEKKSKKAEFKILSLTTLESKSKIILKHVMTYKREHKVEVDL